MQYKQSEQAIKQSEANKANYGMNIYHHRLGTRGYMKKLPDWEKKEEELAHNGVTPVTALWIP